MKPRDLLPKLRNAAARWSPRQRQYALLGALLAGGVALLWLVFSLSQPAIPSARKPAKPPPSAVTNIGVQAPGAQVSPVDEWVGTAGRKLAQYESEREKQSQLNKDRQAFEAATMRRFAELEQRLTSTQQAVTTSRPNEPAPVPTLPPPTSLPTAAPPAPVAPNAPRQMAPARMPAGSPAAMEPPSASLASSPEVPAFTRISIGGRSETSAPASSGPPAAPSTAAASSTFLPVSFTRGRLLGGLDAPTGGQAQSNPHPVLILLSDDSVLPNGHRGRYRNCFVIAAGYGDISSERAYLRTESLSCVRSDGRVLEVRIQGSVYGEDGKLGLRGKLVSKQGAMLANALLAGVVSGIGQGISTSASEVSTSPLGAVTTTTGSDAYRAGVGSGVGRALDRLAQYYIKLAENTHPVIEIDASREVDVVITRGVRIEEHAPIAVDASRTPLEQPLEPPLGPLFSARPLAPPRDAVFPSSSRPPEEFHESDE